MKKRILAFFLTMMMCFTSLTPAFAMTDGTAIEFEHIEEQLQTSEDEVKVVDITEDIDDAEGVDLTEGDDLTEDADLPEDLDITDDTNTTDNTDVIKPVQVIEGLNANFISNTIFNETPEVDDTAYQRYELEDGLYSIYAYDTDFAVSVRNSAKEDGAAIILDDYRYKMSQQYEISKVDEQWYKIIDCYSGKALSVKGNSDKNRAETELRTYEEEDGQLWQFLENEDGYYYIKSKIGTMLNCEPGSHIKDRPLHMHYLNELPLQMWRIEVLEDLIPAYIEEGVFQLADVATCEKVIAPSAFSRSAGVDMILNTALGHRGGQFHIQAYEDGWYMIRNIHTGKVLAASGAEEGAVVKQTEWEALDEQLWRFVYTGNWSFYIQSKAGNFITRENGSTEDRTKIILSSFDQSEAQMWVPQPVGESNDIPVQDGAEYLIVPALDMNHVMEVGDAAAVPGGNIQVAREALSPAQRFRAEEVEEGWYKLVSVHSGMVIEVAGGSTSDAANIHQNEWKGTDSQMWRFVYADGGYCYIQSMSGMLLECASDTLTDGTNIQASVPEKTTGQKFIMCNTSAPNYIHVTTLTEYTVRITLYSPSVENIESVKFPTWSTKNNQSDIVWFDGVKVSDNIWAVELDSKGFKGENWFGLTTHVYMNNAEGSHYAGYRDYALNAHLEGWIYVDGLRRYRLDDGSILNDVSEIFNPDSKYITVDRIKGITTIYGYNKETNAYDTPIKAMWCSVGNPISLTKAGTYSMGWQLKKKEMNASDGSYRCWASYVSQIYGAVYFHGVASDTPDLNTISAGAFRNLGNPASHGCVRLAAIDARWIYYNTGTGTRIRVGDNMAAPMVPIRYEWVGGAIGPDPTYIP